MSMAGGPAVSPYRGRITAGLFAHLFKAVFKQHHRDMLPLLRRLVPADAVVLDVGAHAGQYAKLFARLARLGRVYAIEPQSYARRILRTAIRLNRLHNVEILPLALGSAPGTATLTIPVKRSGSYGFGLAHLGPQTRAGAAETETVEVTTLDALAARLSLPRLDFIKADIEGWEQAMVEGGRQTLMRFRPALLIEFNEQHLMRGGGSVASLWRMLSELGYRAYSGDPGMAPLDRPREGDVLWLAHERAL
ncbi:MAG: FkbM family methyltransferase [Alphaproteobacteria bacterium]|nr:FkbM family methyltransferase [Alphaproteobacteria bacterium]